MKSERCLIKKINKFIVGYCIFPIMLMIGLTFITGAYYERNVFYKLENVTIEIGEKLPEDILNFIGVINESKNFSIETNAKLDNEGHVMSLGTYSYYLVYNDEKYKFSRLTNVKATITVIDTKKPVITINDQNEFDYASNITANDIVKCYDLSDCNLTIEGELNNKQSGKQEITIVAADGANNKSTISTTISIKEKPKPKPVNVYNYSGNIASMNEANNTKNSTLTEEEKNNLRYQIAAFSQQFIGNPYVYGGTSLTNGTDCSGFTMSIYANFGYLLPRTASDQNYMGIEVSANNLLPGDIVVYYYSGFPGHVGIYVGNGMMVHAGTSETGIVMVPMYPGYRTYKRIIY